MFSGSTNLFFQSEIGWMEVRWVEYLSINQIRTSHDEPTGAEYYGYNCIIVNEEIMHYPADKPKQNEVFLCTL